MLSCIYLYNLQFFFLIGKLIFDTVSVVTSHEKIYKFRCTYFGIQCLFDFGGDYVAKQLINGTMQKKYAVKKKHSTRIFFISSRQHTACEFGTQCSHNKWLHNGQLHE